MSLTKSNVTPTNKYHNTSFYDLYAMNQDKMCDEQCESFRSVYRSVNELNQITSTMRKRFDVHDRRSSSCELRSSLTTNVEAVILQNQIDTLEWQLKQVN